MDEQNSEKISYKSDDICYCSLLYNSNYYLFPILSDTWGEVLVTFPKILIDSHVLT